MSNYHKEALFILSPKDEEYAPDMDAMENSKAQRGKETTVIDWDRQEYPLTKFVILSLDSVYLVILQVFGRSLEDPYPSTNKTEQFVIVDCVQAFGTERTLSTKSWTCLNGDGIQLENVCNFNPLNPGYHKLKCAVIIYLDILAIFICLHLGWNSYGRCRRKNISGCRCSKFLRMLSR